MMNLLTSENNCETMLNNNVCRGATIGVGSTIFPRFIISESAFIGLGSKVTHNVPAGETWGGNLVRRIADHNRKK